MQYKTEAEIPRNDAAHRFENPCYAMKPLVQLIPKHQKP